MGAFSKLRARYRLRLKRRRLLWRALRARHALRRVENRTAILKPEDILLFATMRNEALRLPYFLQHYRALGVAHFLIVVNDSSDGTLELLRHAPDVSVWSTQASYRASRFGMDWISWLLLHYGKRHWCLTVDADELLVYPGCETQKLQQLTAWLEAQGANSFGALMLDLYPPGPLSTAHSDPGDDPTKALPLYDAQGYTWEQQARFGNISIRGGPRKRCFFTDRPELAPHLHKIPLVKWNWRYAYVSSTHVALPRRLNRAFDARLNLPTGVLLHTKFLEGAPERAKSEQLRGEHFTHCKDYDAYYAGVAADPDLSTAESCSYRGPQGLVEDGLMTPGAWKA
ncbi:glycosyl transferase family 2 [Rhodobacter aestuarii]|uniref:Glycosyl transferase family 2 n=1 Tax=Rhodobacter aestuarii TaxID=453582 RepID=A0A1N7QF15_9RHOB|nr:glycosyltransferase family 2 protein [Rhodobacter aestuarii]PTV93516.1 glycosyl transferase family 2 [Rhodobacter aestuarii]SIT21359.1 Glycosyl transferase family 2 [Rhodobacter aestuarii]